MAAELAEISLDNLRMTEKLLSHIEIRDGLQYMGSFCWLWTRSKDSGGYGMFWNGKRLGLAHRVAYELLSGEIPKGLQIDHLCRNRACCNPEHMEPVPQSVNTLRGNNFIADNVRKTCCSKCGGEYSLMTRSDGRTYRRCKPCEREGRRRSGKTPRPR